MILAIDPGTHAGWAHMLNGSRSSGTWNFQTKTKTKSRPAEPKHFRLLHANTSLQYHCDTWGFPDLIVCEDAAGFTRGKSAVEASHKFRAVVELFCAVKNIKLLYVQPADVKRWATGKGNADKEEMLAVARERFGYQGSDDNEADAILIREWYLGLK